MANAIRKADSNIPEKAQTRMPDFPQSGFTFPNPTTLRDKIALWLMSEEMRQDFFDSDVRNRRIAYVEGCNEAVAIIGLMSRSSTPTNKTENQTCHKQQ